MSMAGVSPAPPMWLVDDEIVTFTIRGNEESFRLRIWRAVGVAAVVVVSRVAGCAPPCRVTAKLANLVLRAYLAYWPHGMHYVEEETPGGDLRIVDFIGWGHGDRLTLTAPKGKMITPADFTALVGDSVKL